MFLPTPPEPPDWFISFMLTLLIAAIALSVTLVAYITYTTIPAEAWPAIMFCALMFLILWRVVHQGISWLDKREKQHD